VTYGFGERDFALEINTHEITMHFDVLKQHFILAGNTHAQVHTGAQRSKIGFRQKLGVFSLDDQIVRLDIGGQREIRLDLDDVRLDIFDAFLAGHRNAVVAIQHKVSLANLIHINRRHPRATWVVNGQLDARPTGLVALIARQKAAGEVGITSYAANDSIDGD